MKISNNIIAQQSVLRLKKNERNLGSVSLKLNTGYSLNRSKDDSAGMALSLKIDKQIGKQERADRNVLDGISLVQTTDGALTEIHGILQRMRELAVQSSNDVLNDKLDPNATDSDRDKINQEIEELKKEIDSISNKTNFNGIKTLNCIKNKNGDYPTIKIQIGEDKLMEMDINLERITTDSLKVDVLDYSTRQGSSDAITACDWAIAKVSEYRTRLGSYENRLTVTNQNLGVMIETNTGSLSRIRDTDMALEMTNYTKFNVIAQATTSILAQANQRPQQVLQLLN